MRMQYWDGFFSVFAQIYGNEKSFPCYKSVRATMGGKSVDTLETIRFSSQRLGHIPLVPPKQILYREEGADKLKPLMLPNR